MRSCMRAQPSTRLAQRPALDPRASPAPGALQHPWRARPPQAAPTWAWMWARPARIWRRMDQRRSSSSSPLSSTSRSVRGLVGGGGAGVRRAGWSRVQVWRSERCEWSARPAASSAKRLAKQGQRSGGGGRGGQRAPDTRSTIAACPTPPHQYSICARRGRRVRRQHVKSCLSRPVQSSMHRTWYTSTRPPTHLYVERLLLHLVPPPRA